VAAEAFVNVHVLLEGRVVVVRLLAHLAHVRLHTCSTN
jgi:hypothetical protein